MDDVRELEAIDLAADGGLGEPERAALAARLDGRPEARRELDAVRATIARLESTRIPVRPGFAGEVMAALEPAPWEARAPKSWRLPLAMLLVFAAGAAALVGRGAAAFAPEGGAGGALLALADLLRASLVAGSGLATASFKAVGAAAGSWLGESPANWAAAIVLVVGLHYFLYRLITMRRPSAALASATRSRDRA